MILSFKLFFSHLNKYLIIFKFNEHVSEVCTWALFKDFENYVQSLVCKDLRDYFRNFQIQIMADFGHFGPTAIGSFTQFFKVHPEGPNLFIMFYILYSYQGDIHSKDSKVSSS